MAGSSKKDVITANFIENYFSYLLAPVRWVLPAPYSASSSWVIWPECVLVRLIGHQILICWDNFIIKIRRRETKQYSPNTSQNEVTRRISKKIGDGMEVKDLVFALESLCLDHFITFSVLLVGQIWNIYSIKTLDRTLGIWRCEQCVCWGGALTTVTMEDWEHIPMSQHHQRWYPGLSIPEVHLQTVVIRQCDTTVECGENYGHFCCCYGHIVWPSQSSLKLLGIIEWTLTQNNQIIELTLV